MDLSNLFSIGGPQKRFCATFINKTTKQPIQGMPVYAEARASARPDYKVTLTEQDREATRKAFFHLETIDYTALIEFFENYMTDYGLVFSYEELRLILSAFLNYVVDFAKSNPSVPPNEALKEFLGKAIAELQMRGSVGKGKLKDDKDRSYVKPFGFLSTDHVGFVSFEIEGAAKALKSMMNTSHIQAGDIQFWMFPRGEQLAGIDVSSLKKITSEYVYGVLEIDELAVQSAVTYHSMHNPSLIEWYLSPSSFSVNPRYMIGGDGCEQFFPANFATSDFRFHQTIRGDELPDNPQLRDGVLCEYMTTWQPLGHTLGQVLYSLPLAPGEIVKIAIIDWSRNSEDGRNEDTGLSESVDHSTLRDRTISETVKGALSEWQRGGSIMGGNSGGAGVSFGMQNLGVSAGNAHSFGGGYSTSSGNRDFTVATVQHVNDAFSQHSTAMRELRSTIVVQSDQKESAKAESRVIANYNHSHSLTMLYYEVLRHFKVVTRFVRSSSVLLINYSSERRSFEAHFEVQQHRLVLERVLLDERFRSAFDLVAKYLEIEKESEYQNSKLGDPEADIIFKSYNLEFETGNDGFDGNVFVKLTTSNAGIFTLLPPVQDSSGRIGFSASFEQGDTNSFENCFIPGGPLRWGDLERVEISVEGGQGWLLRKFSMDGVPAEGPKKTLYNNVVAVTLEDDGMKSISLSIKTPVPQNPSPSANDVLHPEERAHLFSFMEHMRRYAGFYNREIWLGEDPNDRASRFESINVNGIAVIDLIENRPVDVLGNFVVFPSNRHYDEGKYQIKPAKNEKLMTLPSRGVFGEAKLGHCNASEIIDNTRFWDWQQSPIPEKATEIKELDTSTRNDSKDLTPTVFPNSIVNIVSPTAAPDPTGMAGALQLLGKSDIFRDMSMSAQVTDLLKQLSQDAVKYGEMANKARDILGQTGGSPVTGSSGIPSAPGSQSTGASTASQAPAPTQAESERAQIDNTERKLKIAKDHLPPEQQAIVRQQSVAELTAVERRIYVDLHSSDEGTLLEVLEPADYDIDGRYMGKLNFGDGATVIRTKAAAGNLHIKFRARVANFTGREYVSKIPGLSAQTGDYYFNTAAFFKFPPIESGGATGESPAINMKGVVTLQPPLTVKVHANASGQLTLQAGVEVEAAKIAKIAFGGEVQLGVEIGTEFEYIVTIISGIKLAQTQTAG